ncbi:MAG: hypothetical protein KAY04_00160 [Burkholderiales bacterium]|nr:hypothetical protein [Burkholderiales bacterium]
MFLRNLYSLILGLACCFTAALSAHACAISIDPPAQVMIVGTWHFTNPNQDMHNIQSDDMLSIKRQKEIFAASKGLEKTSNRTWWRWNGRAMRWMRVTPLIASASCRPRRCAMKWYSSASAWPRIAT